MRAGLGAWLRFAALGVVVAAWGCGPEFTAGTTGTGGGGPSTGGHGGGGAGGGGAGGTGGGTGGAGGSTCTNVDADGDTFDDCDDCNDADPLIYPGAPEICGDGVDNSCDDVADPEDLCHGLGTFVSDSGDDMNPGTTQAPVRTIAKGLENALQIVTKPDVYVAEGTYDEDVVLTEGISLLGGYQKDTWERDPASYKSEIECQTFQCVRAGGDITRATELNGFTIHGRSGQPSSPPGSVAVHINGGEPTLRNNEILAGEVNSSVNNAKNSVGVQILGLSEQGGPLLEGNIITAGQANEVSAAVLIEAQAQAEIRGNQIRGGEGAQSYGVWDKGTAAATLDANAIQAGAASMGHAFAVICRGQITLNANRINTDLAAPPTCQSASLWCGGIASYSSRATITNNVVFGASADASTAMYLTEQEMALQQLHLHSNYLDASGKESPGANARSAAVVLHSPFMGQQSALLGLIRNNILAGGRNIQRFGVYEEATLGQTCSPAAFDNNLFYFPMQVGAVDVLYRDWNGNSTVPITMLAGLPPGYANNQHDDPRIDADFHLMSDSPCIDAGTSESAPALDFEGDARPQGAGFDIGPDEAM